MQVSQNPINVQQLVQGLSGTLPADRAQEIENKISARLETIEDNFLAENPGAASEGTIKEALQNAVNDVAKIISENKEALSGSNIAPQMMQLPASRERGSLASMLGGKGGKAVFFEDIIAQFMFEVMRETQDELKEVMKAYKSGEGANRQPGVSGAAGEGAGVNGQASMSAQDAGGPATTALDGSDSRALMMEEIKMLAQNMQQMQQAMSNTLNVMHKTAMNTIGNIR